MKLLKSCCLLAAGCWAVGAFACDNPDLVVVPTGTSASKQQLLAARDQIQTYMTAMNAYLACLDKNLKAQGDKAPAQYKTLMITRHNAAVNEMDAIADAFNKQVRAYKAAHGQGGQAADKDKKGK